MLTTWGTEQDFGPCPKEKQVFPVLKQAQDLAPELALSNIDKPFHLFVDERKAMAWGSYPPNEDPGSNLLLVSLRS